MLTVTERPRRKRLSWESRCEIVAKVRLQGMSPAAAAGCSGVHRATVYRLLSRFDASGWAGLVDRRPVPHRQPRRLSAAAEARILNARSASHYGPKRLGAILGVPGSTVAKVLVRHGASRRPRAARPEAVRYERERPGELLHVDTKRLGRFHQVGKAILADGIQRSPRAGWHHLHVAVDDHTRIAFVQAHADEKGPTCAAFLADALAFFAQLGIDVERVMTDNAKNYVVSRDFQAALGDRAHKRIRPYRPQTNGKVERFNRTLLDEWAYVRAYDTNTERLETLQPWVTDYNWQRAHSALGNRPPVSRLPSTT